MDKVLEQHLKDAMPFLGDVGSIVRIPDGFEIRVSRKEEGLVIYHIPFSLSADSPSFLNDGQPEFAIGWYQDPEANLFYYEGKGYWKDSGRINSEKLTARYTTGELEFLG